MNRMLSWLIALACVGMVIIGYSALGEPSDLIQRRVAIQTTGAVDDSVSVRVNTVRVGQAYSIDDKLRLRTQALLLVVNTTIENHRGRDGNFRVFGYANGRTFQQTHGVVTVPEPGYSATGDILFELDPADLAGFELGFSTRATFYALDTELIVDLGLDPAEADQLIAEHRFDRVIGAASVEETLR